MKCSYCGKDYNGGNFCPHCGAKSPDPQPAAPQQNYQPPAPQYPQPNQYQNQNQYQNPNNYGAPVAMVQRRSIATCIILSIVTCGIYGIFWFISLTDDTRTLSNDVSGASGGTAFLYAILTCGIYYFYWAYKQGVRIDAARQSRGLTPSNQGALYLILFIFGLGIVGYCLMQNEINQMANA